MLTLNDYLKNCVLESRIDEVRGKPIDDYWLNNKKPVMTKDGRNVLIEKIDYSHNPNIIIGKVSENDKLLDFKWEDDGTCTEAQDKFGNPRDVDENDNLVKAS